MGLFFYSLSLNAARERARIGYCKQGVKNVSCKAFEAFEASNSSHLEKKSHPS